MTYKYKILSIDVKNGTFVIEFEGIRALNFNIPHDGNSFLTGDELEDAIQKLYPKDDEEAIMPTFENFGNIEAIKNLIVTHAPTATSMEMTEARQQRNKLLRASDWTQISDAPIQQYKKDEWAAYRQQLRDLPQQPGFPVVDWPLPPDTATTAIEVLP